MAQAPIVITDDTDYSPSLHDLGSDDHIALPGAPLPAERSDPGAGQQQARQPETQYIIEDDRPAARPQEQERDSRLADDQGDGTYLDTQRRSRADRRERQRQGKDRTLRELEELRQRNAELEAKFGEIEPRLRQIDVSRVQDEVRRLEQDLTEQTQRAASARRAMAEATAAGDADAMTQALDARDAALEASRVLAARKVTLEQGLERAVGDQGQGSPEPNGRQQRADLPIMQPPPAAVRQRIEEFQEKFPWYNTRELDNSGRPVDWKTRTVLDIDFEVAQEGFTPNTDDYWAEIEDRMRERLPRSLFEGAGRQPQSRSQDDPPPRQRQPEVPPQRRGPAMPGAGDRPNANGGPRRVHLTPGRKEALIQAGVLANDGRTVQNQQRFERLLREYDTFDRENAQ